jgi:hypothetical protein
VSTMYNRPLPPPPPSGVSLTGGLDSAADETSKEYMETLINAARFRGSHAADRDTRRERLAQVEQAEAARLQAIADAPRLAAEREAAERAAQQQRADQEAADRAAEQAEAARQQALAAATLNADIAAAQQRAVAQAMANYEERMRPIRDTIEAAERSADKLDAALNDMGV